MGLLTKAAVIGAGIYAVKHLKEKKDNQKAGAQYEQQQQQGQGQFAPQGHQQQQYQQGHGQQYQQNQQQQYAPHGEKGGPPSYVQHNGGYGAEKMGGK
ncbi:hypothetical protein V499_05167 [Pseudogymnoascus sp. VKM F-103]|uniref:Uncharacterized protein n=1 Tax=Pseudogymnoascus verrucosus TaxID=342668 RepID=A0A1B8GSG2_9PEZI|nr:uncharacterized protein VE01_03339 [Pseudogymnoascus verrucosus]KFY74839.1 hypothetical protein V499_05167 [Pseudogymnoascus sp. VKM F-103]OBT98766.1 hypothetical protein VE01_03339 [Pseudogymnoascus verrucosus]